PAGVLHVRRGDRLTFGRRILGARAYVAISGGIETPLILGSRATHVPSGMGRALKAGDELPLGPPKGGHHVRPGPPKGGHYVRMVSASPTTLRVLPGPQTDRFAAGALEALQSATYRIGTDSNRMGYRLSGPRLEHTSGADIISDATPIGVL